MLHQTVQLVKQITVQISNLIRREVSTEMSETQSVSCMTCLEIAQRPMLSILSLLVCGWRTIKKVCTEV